MNKPSIEAIYPLSSLQQGILFHCLRDPGAAPYWTQYTCFLNGALDIAAFRRAWEEVTRRHPVLRTAFVWDNPGNPLQVVMKSVNLDWQEHDWEQTADLDGKMNALLQADQRRGYELKRAPLMRFALCRVAADRHWFVWSHHHLLLDGWSMQLVLTEVLNVYEAARNHQTVSLPAVRPYRDYIAWLQRQNLKEAEAVWRKLLGGFRAPTPLVVDGIARASTATSDAPPRRLRLSAEETATLQAFARAQRVTLNTLVQGAWALLLSRYNNEPDVLFGATVSGRPAELPGVESMVGLFINTLPLRVQVDADAGVAGWLRQLQDQQAGLREFEFTPLVQTQAWSDVPRGTPLFESILVFENYPVDESLKHRPDRVAISDVRSVERTNYPLTVVAFANPDLTLQIMFDAARFDEPTIDRMLGHLKTLLLGMAAEPDRPLSRVPLLTGEERRQLLEEWNDASASHAPDRCIHQRFEAQVARRPEAVAVVFGDQRLTYRELNARANQLANYLRRQGVGPDVLVGLCMERTADLVIGVLGILKAGGAYLPLDLAYPKDRVAFMLSDAKAPILLTRQKLVDGLSGHTAKVVCLDSDWPGIAKESGGNPDSGARPEHLAYVIYTSGSTGKPKGMLITHHNVVRLFQATQPWFHFDEKDVWTLFHSYAFDFSVWEIWGALIYGGRLVVVPYLTSRSPEAFYRLLCDERVTVLNQTPSAFRQLMQAEEVAGQNPDLALRYVIFGGEALELRSLKPWFDRHGDQRPQLVNMYGITETTVHVTYRPIGASDLASGSVIGVPIPDLQVYVLDANQQLAPVGVPGEIHVGGDGLGRGYLNRPELTAQKFIPDPFSGRPSARLYRSGDLARYLPGGDLEYLGRSDHQVKIRGFRIELGEIESVLNQHPGIRESVVLAREDAPGNKRLVAYLVPADGDGPAINDLREHLRAKVPDYMVPSAFVTLEKLPLTNNGKVDRKALPEPGADRPDLEKQFVPPRTPVEQTLARIWSEILRVERVGVRDNFFELGGDSILSIQIIAAARRAGVRITPKQFFEHQTIAELAALAAEAQTMSLDQGSTSGTVPLTPIQHWFFEQEFTEPDFWNQTCLVELEEKLDRSALEQALQALAAHHDALRLRFHRNGKMWRQEYASDAPPVPVEWVDLSATPSDAIQPAIIATANKLQAGLSLAEGRLIRAAYFDLGPDRKHRLFIALHHLAVDGVSWRILLDDLEVAYTQIRDGKQASLPDKTSSYKKWAERLGEFAKSGAMRKEQDFWLNQNDGAPAGLPVDADPVGPNTEASARTITVTLSEDETRALLQRVPAVFNTQINDALLAAMLLAWQRRTGLDALRLDLEGHGREELWKDVDVSRTVGWFTSIFPVCLRLPETRETGEVLKSVKEHLRRVPGRGIGYGLLRYLSDDAAIVSRLKSQPEPAIVFNYLGQFDGALSGSKLFRLLTDSTGSTHGPNLLRRHQLDINAQVAGGRLRVSWTYSSHLHRRETIEQLAEGYLNAVRELVACCQFSSARRYTPSDFPLATLDQASLDRLVKDHPDLEDIYALSPMQELFHTLEGAQSQVGFEQWHSILTGNLNARAFREAWNALLRRHSILRTAFVSDGLPSPLQVVRRNPELPWSELDWRAASKEEQARRLEALLRADRETGFELSHAPLLRVTLVRMDEEVHHLVWSAHHLLIDGWSCPILLDELAKIYTALTEERNATLAQPLSYRDYIAWLQQQDPREAESFWRRQLEGFTAPTPIVPGRTTAEIGANGDRFADEEIALSAEITSGIQACARQHQLTLNLLVQAAWAMVLRHHSGQSDVIFGATFSGRPAELEGVETMVGACVNNVPVRATVRTEQPLLEWLKQLQQSNFQISHHQYSSLVAIQGWSPVPWRYRLFESLIVFQNYLDNSTSRLGGDVQIQAVSGPDRTNYPITLMAFPSDRLRLRMIYDRQRIDTPAIRRLLWDTEALLSRMAGPAERLTGDVLSGLAAPLSDPRQSARTEQGRQRTAATYVAPGTDMERKLAGVWESAFQLERVGIHDNFFDLGGHSVLMVQVHTRLQSALGRHISIARMFQHPTISALAKYLAEGENDRESTLQIQDRARRQREALARRRPVVKRT